MALDVIKQCALRWTMSKCWRL